ncbi:hypothetical protein [Pontibacter sp. SGAir0037]|uniref:hypothetical protein n=1 Tax=Pontibacter sp. SGAir0037 TaxID=2571030 RepID=UPI0010F6DE6B|nr:hypothetical protein [Pontibacter sp. SGAir0037]
MALFVAFCVVDAVYLESIARLNSYPRSVGSALLILLALLYFYKVFNDMDKLFLEHDPMFLLSAGIVIYYAGTATVFSFLNEVMAHSYEDARMLVNITILLTISFNLLLMVVMRKAPAK